MNLPEPLYQRLINHLSTAILLVDDHMHICYINDAAETLLGRSSSRVNEQHLSSLFRNQMIPPELTEHLQQAVPFTQREASWQLAGDDPPLQLDYAVNFLQIGLKTCCLLEIHSRDRINRINRDKAFFSEYQTSRNVVRGLAHEIKNPLGGIRGAAQLLERSTNNDTSDYTRIIIEEVDRLKALVDRMLGPVQPGKRDLVNIHRVVEQILGITKAESHSQIALLRDYDPSLPEFLGDNERIHQALLNIVGNARQNLAESGTEQATIRIKTRAAHQMTLGGKLHRLVCIVEIDDNGPGIPPDLAKNIFYPMVSGRAQGSGLGLSIAQQYISQHNGIIEFSSQPGNTRFSVMLPMEIGK